MQTEEKNTIQTSEEEVTLLKKQSHGKGYYLVGEIIVDDDVHTFNVNTTTKQIRGHLVITTMKEIKR